MNSSPDLLPDLAERLGWALLHSLWQGALIAAVLAAALALIPKALASLRHAACLLALAALGCGFGFTAWKLDGTSAATRSAPLVALTAAPGLGAARTAGEMEQPANAAPAGFRSSLENIESRANAAALRPRNDLPSRFWQERFEAAAPWLTAGWVFGVALLSARQLGGRWRVRRLRRDGRSARTEWQQAFARLAEEFGIGARVRLLESAEAVGPMLAGLFKPIVLLPVQLATGLSAAELEAILAHELAHLAQRDAWSNFAQLALETLFFYHPAVWWIGHCARQEREHAADDLALGVCTDRRLYAGALTRLAELQLVPSPALAATGGNLLTRIRRIVRPEAVETLASGWSLGVPALLTALALAAIFHVRADDASASAQTERASPRTQNRGEIVAMKLELGYTPARIGLSAFDEFAPLSFAANGMPMEDTKPRTPWVKMRKTLEEAASLESRAANGAVSVAESPAASILPAAPTSPTPKPVLTQGIVQLSTNGSLKWNGAELSSEALSAELKVRAQEFPDFAVTVRAAKDVDYKAVLKVLELCREANVWKVAFATDEANAAAATAPEAASEEAQRVAKLVAANRQAARLRASDDQRTYTPEQLREIETLYQVANTKGKRSPEARASLTQLLEKYDKANRTGCATLYLGQASEGAERLEYLTRAVEKFSGCYYFNGCQVGGYGRYVLALTLWERGDKDKARALLAELKTKYKDATDHRGQPMGPIAEAVENELAARE